MTVMTMNEDIQDYIIINMIKILQVSSEVLIPDIEYTNVPVKHTIQDFRYVPVQPCSCC